MRLLLAFVLVLAVALALGTLGAPPWVWVLSLPLFGVWVLRVLVDRRDPGC